MHSNTRFDGSIFGTIWNPAKKRLAIIVALLFLILLFLTLGAQPAPAQVLTIVHNFVGSDGASPASGLIHPSDGNLYGTTAGGGTNCSPAGGCGTVFKITPGGTLTTLHSFAGPPGEGREPWAGLIQGSDGNFYGTTAEGGANICGVVECGTVFKITPNGTLTVLHNFAGGDGASPYSGLVQASDGNFYGTTQNGGLNDCIYGCGIVFKITPDGTLTVLHSFERSDGGGPSAGLVQGSDGNLYGATFYGGADNDGTVFKITPDGTLTTLHSFMGPPGDGANPGAGLIQASDGNFYGTTFAGGANCSPYGCGTVFKMTPSGTLTVLHSFAGSDGANPGAVLMQASDGNFYGTTAYGGANNFGTVFKITPDGTLTTLHSLAESDGQYPASGLVQLSGGNFYGTGYDGGVDNKGTIFRVVIVCAHTNCPLE